MMFLYQRHRLRECHKVCNFNFVMIIMACLSQNVRNVNDKTFYSAFFNFFLIVLFLHAIVFIQCTVFNITLLHCTIKIQEMTF